MSINNAWDKFRAAAKKDPKKAGVLAVLVLVMGGMWVKVLGRPAPATAAAADAAPATAAVTPAGAPGTGSAAPSYKPKSKSATRAAWAAMKLAPASRNLFQIDYQRYERSGKAPGDQPLTEGQTSSPKSGPSPADLKKERQILVNNLQSQATQLKLQTIVMGASPKALVNGRLVGEGDVIASFRVAKITARGITVEREGIRFDVSMKQ
jgi:hypothetical protein